MRRPSPRRTSSHCRAAPTPQNSRPTTRPGTAPTSRRAPARGERSKLTSWSRSQPRICCCSRAGASSSRAPEPWSICRPGDRPLAAAGATLACAADQHAEGTDLAQSRRGAFLTVRARIELAVRVHLLRLPPRRLPPMPSWTAGGRGPSAYPLVGTRVYHRRTMQRKPSDPQGAPRPAFGRSKRSQLNVIDYTLAKRALLRDAQAGLQSVNELCDAHPELMRAAKYVGEPTRSDCPVCKKDKLVLLAYVYGDRLKQENGRVWSIDTGMRMAAADPDTCCYVVEVCRSCQWNHLREAFTGRHTATG